MEGRDVGARRDDAVDAVALEVDRLPAPTALRLRVHRLLRLLGLGCTFAQATGGAEIGLEGSLIVRLAFRPVGTRGLTLRAR